MEANLHRLGGLVHSQRVLLALVQKGLGRDEAYALVQRVAMPVWKTKVDFASLLKSNPAVAKLLTPSEIDELFDLRYHMKHVDLIFSRVFDQSYL
jgi:adenylosuccinate lyase